MKNLHAKNKNFEHKIFCKMLVCMLFCIESEKLVYMIKCD